MPGAATDAGASYSSSVGLIYVFNLIVGTGALAMPKAFQQAGWLISMIVVTLLAFTSYVTVTFVVEAMAAANAMLKWKKIENMKESGSITDPTVERLRSSPTEERSPLLAGIENRGGGGARSHYAVQHDREAGGEEVAGDFYDIKERVELGKMASLFFNKLGVNLFYIVIAVYLYGDLAIYVAAVPKSLRDLVCTQRHDDQHCNKTLTDSDPCWSGSEVTRLNAYRIFVAGFSVLLGPFVFFNVQKTKYLQLFTTVLRWLAFGLMIILTTIQIAKGQGGGRPPVARVSGVPNLFGVCVYSFMCHHSLPTLVTPIRDKGKLAKLFAADYALILAFYALLSFTGIFAFASVDDLYTSNFLPAKCSDEHQHVVTSVVFFQYFLALFPVFTLSTNFPIIAITLRNNLRTLVQRDKPSLPWVVESVVIPLGAIIPPIAVAFATHDLEMLVGVTGSYAGAAIQYLIPAALVYCSRKKLRFLLGSERVNRHTSPFAHRVWLWIIVLWSTAAIAFVTANHIITKK